MNVGDIVQLREGGPLMTIEGIDGLAIVCVWFNDGEICRGRFGRSLLRVLDVSERESQ